MYLKMHILEIHVNHKKITNYIKKCRNLNLILRGTVYPPIKMDLSQEVIER